MTTNQHDDRFNIWRYRVMDINEATALSFGEDPRRVDNIMGQIARLGHEAHGKGASWVMDQVHREDHEREKGRKRILAAIQDGRIEAELDKTTGQYQIHLSSLVAWLRTFGELPPILRSFDEELPQQPQTIENQQLPNARDTSKVFSIPKKLGYYSPLEAAIRWCGFVENEAEIKRSVALQQETDLDNGEPDSDFLPYVKGWPNLREAHDMIIEAVLEDNIKVNFHLGVPPGKIADIELRRWFRSFLPDQRPLFLFDGDEDNDEDNDEASAELRQKVFELEQQRSVINESFTELERQNEALKAELVALRKQVESLQSSTRPQQTRARRTLLTLIAALCDYSDLDWLKPGVAAQISKMTETIDAPVSDDTVRGVLKEIPDALESRQV